MAAAPLVSFVVPCYMHGHFVAECVQSILAQTFESFEILIMDDCSPDETPVVARSFTDPRVIHVRNERNLGHLANYNKGIGLARGKYVWLINVDDYLRQPYVLEKFVAVMEKAPTVAYVFCRAFSVRDGVETAPHSIHGSVDRIIHGRDFVKRIVVRNTIATPAVMVRRTSYDRVGMFPPDLPHSGDWLQWCRHALFGDVAYFAEPMVCYRVHDGNMTKWFMTHAEKLIHNEVEVRWRVRSLAQELGDTALVDAATRAIGWDYGLRVGLRLTENWNLGMTWSEFEASLREHTDDKAMINGVTATVLRSVGDEYYKIGDMPAARSYYGRALTANPADAATWAKRGLAATGGVGRSLRTAAARFRGVRHHQECRS